MSSCCRRKIRWSYVVLLIASLPAKGQPDGQDEKKEFQDFIGHVIQFFYHVKTDERPPADMFYPYFDPDSVALDNQFNSKGTLSFDAATDYFLDITSFFYHNRITDLEVHQSAPFAISYGKKGPDYYAWVYQSFRYTYGSEKRDEHGWVELHARRSRSDRSFSILSLTKVTQPLSDIGWDQVPQPPAERPRVLQPRAPQPPADQLVEQPHAEPEADERRLKEAADRQRILAYKIKHEIKPPSSRFSLDFSFGGLAPVPDSGRMPHYNGGYLGNLSFHLHVHRLLDFGVGIMHIYDEMDLTAFQQSIEHYLTANHVGYQNVTATSTAFRYHMVYASFGLANYRSTRAVVALEPLIGWVYSDWFFHNQVNVGINYDGVDTQTSHISLGGAPFLAEGAKVMLQLRLDRDGMVRLQLSGYYLQGKSSAAAPLLAFTHAQQPMPAPANNLQVMAVTLGIHFTLNRPRDF